MKKKETMKMAKYTVEHACGHTHEYQLFGPLKERDRKLEWLAEQDCPACRRKAELEKAATDDTPVSAFAMPIMASGEVGLSLCLEFQGGTFRCKEDLREMGATYDELPCNSGLLGVFRKPVLVWFKIITIAPEKLMSALESHEALVGAIRQASGMPEDIAVELPQADTPAAAMLYNDIKSAIKQAERLKSVPAEPALKSLPEMLGFGGRHWNGKFYGKDGLTVYIDGEKTDVPAAVKSEWEAMKQAHDEWKAARDAAVKG